MSETPNIIVRDEGNLSPANEESDSGFLSPQEPEPAPGLHGTPVRCM